MSNAAVARPVLVLIGLAIVKNAIEGSAINLRNGFSMKLRIKSGDGLGMADRDFNCREYRRICGLRK